MSIFLKPGCASLRLIKLSIAAVAALCLSVPLLAVDPHRMLSQYLHDFWGIEQGFPGGSITSIGQSSDGYLWIGTDKGLTRYDGLSFQQFDRANSGPVTIGPVRSVLADQYGNVWILLRNTKLLRYANGSLDLSRGRAENGITAMGKGPGDSILLSSLAMGTLRYDGKQFIPVPSGSSHGESPVPTTAVAPDERSTRLSWSAGLESDRIAYPTPSVISILATGDRSVFFGTDAGLFHQQEGHISAASGLRDMKVSCILPLENSDLWIGTDKGMLRWAAGKLTSEGIPALLLHVEVLSMMRDRDSNIWVGTTRGLLRFNPNGIPTLAQETPASGDAVTALFEDREGNIWIGHPHTLERLRDTAFITYAAQAGKSQNIGPLYVDADGYTWFSPIEGGLRWLKEGKAGSVTAAGLNDDVVYSIAGNGKDGLWLGRQQGGLTHLSDIHTAPTAKTYSRLSGLAQNSVYAVHESPDGTVWAGTLTGGVSELRNGRFTNYTSASGLASDTVSSISESADGTMWFGTPNGLSAFSKNSWRTYTLANGLPSGDINCLLEDSAAVLWIGTATGLAYLTAGKIHAPTVTPDSLHEPIFGIAEDLNGWLLITTSRHVLRVRRASLMADVPGDNDEREFSVSDGLLGTEGVKRYQSAVKDSRGRIWISTNRGVSVLDPSHANNDSPPAIVQVEELSEDGTPMELRAPILIPPGSHRITLSYSGLSLSNPERVRFKYELDGFDQAWSQPVSTRTAVYTNLNWGRYTFRVMASNSDGVWNQKTANLAFSIQPAWYQMTWFRILCLVSALFTAWMIYRLRMRQVARVIGTRFDERLAERTRIARELHDTFLQTIQGSKLVAEDALEDPMDHERMVRALEKLSVWLGQAAQEGRAALNSLRISTVQTNDLSEALRRATENGFVPSSLAIAFTVVGASRELHPIVRDEVYHIGYEAIRNAYTHSRASRLEIELKYAHDLSLHVSDNGVGIEPAIVERGKDGHFGLQGMRERAKRIGGKLTVHSSASGTEVTVVVPGGISFRNPK